METLPDSELVKRSLGGDAGAFEHLYRRHYAHVYALAFKWAGQREDAEDIAQEVFVKLARKLGTYHGESSFGTWLYRITMNTAKDFSRRSASRKEKERMFAQETKTLKQEARDNPGPEEAHKLYEALRELPEKLREAVVLVYAQGMNHREAAGVIGCAETTVSWRVFQARRKLKKLLGHEV